MGRSCGRQVSTAKREDRGNAHHADTKAKEDTLHEDVLVVRFTDTRNHHTEDEDCCARYHEYMRSVRIEYVSYEAALWCIAAMSCVGNLIRRDSLPKRRRPIAGWIRSTIWSMVVGG